MAKRLVTAGFPVTVFNRTPEKAESVIEAGARLAESIREVVHESEIVISMVRDDAASRSVWLSESSTLSALRKNQVVIESSTLSVRWVKELGKMVAACGANYVDAPVLGSLPQAESGQLIYLLGGTSGNDLRLASVVKALAGSQHHFPNVGDATTMKLAVNGYFATQVAALRDAFNILRNNDINLNEANSVFQSLPIVSPSLKGILTLVANGDHAPRFPVSLVRKDLLYALEALGDAQNASLLAHVESLLKKTEEAGEGNRNLSVVVSGDGL